MWGFPVIHALQPFHPASRKVPAAWEQVLGGPAAWAQCGTVIEGEMAGDSGFVSRTGMFDADVSTVFVDQNAHVTEEGNRQVAARIADALLPLLTRPGSVSLPTAR